MHTELADGRDAAAVASQAGQAAVAAEEAAEQGPSKVGVGRVAAECTGHRQREKCVTVCGAPMIEAQTLGLASRPSPPLLRDTQPLHRALSSALNSRLFRSSPAEEQGGARRARHAAAGQPARTAARGSGRRRALLRG